MSEPARKKLKMSLCAPSINEVFPNEILTKILVDHLCTYPWSRYCVERTPEKYLRGGSISKRAKDATISLGVLLATSVCRQWRHIVLEHVGANNIWSVGPTEWSKGVPTFEPPNPPALVFDCAYLGNEEVLGQILNRADESFRHQLFIEPSFHRALRRGHNTPMLGRIMETFSPMFRASTLAMYQCLKTAVRGNDRELTWQICALEDHAPLDDAEGYRDGDDKIKHIFSRRRLFDFISCDAGLWMKNVAAYMMLKYQKTELLREWVRYGLVAHILGHPRNLCNIVLRAIRAGAVTFLRYLLGLFDKPLAESFAQIIDSGPERVRSVDSALASKSLDMAQFVFRDLLGDGDSGPNIQGGAICGDDDIKRVPMLPHAIANAPLPVIRMFTERFPRYRFDDIYAPVILPAIAMGDVEKARWAVANCEASRQFLDMHIVQDTSTLYCFFPPTGSVDIMEYIYHECGVPLELGMGEVMMTCPVTMKWVYAEWRKQPGFETKRTGFENAFIRGTDNDHPLRYVATLRDMECARLFFDMFPEFLKRARNRITTAAACFNNLKLLRMLKDRYGPFIKILRCKDEAGTGKHIELGTLKWLHAQGRECVWIPGWITASYYICMDSPTQYWLKERYMEIPGIAEILASLPPPDATESEPNSHGAHPRWSLVPYCGNIHD